MDIGRTLLPTLPSSELVLSAASATADRIRSTICAIDPYRRLGHEDDPIFMSACLDGDSASKISFLGLNRDTERRLAYYLGEAAVATHRADLHVVLGTAGGDGEVPADPVSQVIAAATVLKASAPTGQLRLSLQPLLSAPGSGTGLAFSCDPSTGVTGLTGRYLPGGTGAQLLVKGGEDIRALVATEPWGAILQTTVSTAAARLGMPASVEFVVDRGRLWIAETGPVALSGAALLRVVARGQRRGRLKPAEAVALVSQTDLEAALSADGQVLSLPRVAQGAGVSPGVATGALVFSAADAIAFRAEGKHPVLALYEARPEDLPGLLASMAVITERGGRPSHAAVVARGLGRPAVTALTDATVDSGEPAFRPARGDPLHVGELVTVDGQTGAVYRATRDTHAASPSTTTESLEWLTSILSEPFAARTEVDVLVNADTADEARRGRDFGAVGVGLCRIEHMFLGSRQPYIQRVLTARPGPELTEGLAELESLLKAELRGIFLAMDALPVTVRLLDPPRHEFLPDISEFAARVAADADWDGGARTLRILRRLHEHNPMLGTRGVRLGLMVPELMTMQITALVEVVLALRRAGHDPRAELLVPMVSIPAELDAVRGLVTAVCGRLGTSPDDLGIRLGAMIETPRAALLAGELASQADFFSLWTNDLTALVWGLSRDDAERDLLPRYQQLGVVAESPFERLDVAGVGGLIRQLADQARAAHPGIRIGACGEQAAESNSLRFLADAGVDYISCAASRVPLARYALAQLQCVAGAGSKGCSDG